MWVDCPLTFRMLKYISQLSTWLYIFCDIVSCLCEFIANFWQIRIHRETRLKVISNFCVFRRLKL